MRAVTSRVVRAGPRILTPCALRPSQASGAHILLLQNGDGALQGIDALAEVLLLLEEGGVVLAGRRSPSERREVAARETHAFRIGSLQFIA